MTAGDPRSARQVDATSREVAEDLARRSGMTLNEWVTRLMAEGPEDATSQDYFAQGSYSQGPSSQGSPNYIEAPRAMPTPRYEAVGHPADEVSRVAQAIERLSDRIAAAESRQALAIAGVERSVREVIGRIDSAEREQMQVAARFEGELEETKAETGRFAERLRHVETEASGPRSVEALRSLESALGKVAGHVYEGDRRARDAIEEIRGRVERLDTNEQSSLSAIHELKASCALLDDRLALAESADDGVAKLADNLSARFDAAREDLGRQLATAAEARFDRVEQALAQMSEHVRTAEQRQAGALERMGREVLDVAQSLNRRVQTVERGAGESTDRLGADMARIANAVENRLGRADAIQAQALEKLGGEIARITERLADRIANAERRSAQAIDHVGEQVTRVTERIAERHERSVGELSDRIRQSEERTARLLEEARQKIDDRLAETQRRAEAPRTPALDHDDDDDDALFADAPFPAFDTPPAERPFSRVTAEQPFAPPAFAPAPAYEAADAEFAEPPSFDDEDFEAASDFDHAAPAAADDLDAPFDEIEAAPHDEPAAEAHEIEAEPPEFHAVAANHPLLAEASDASEADVFAAPLASAPAEAEAVDLEPNVGFDMDDELLPPHAEPPSFAAEAHEPEPAALAPEPAAPLSTREVIDRARAAARAAGPAPRARAAASTADRSVLDSVAFGRPRRKPSSGFSGALMVASLLAALGLGAGGYVFLEGKSGGLLPKRASDSLANNGATPDQSGAPIAAMALSPKPAAGPDMTAAYTAAIARISANDAGGLPDLRHLADGGFAPAQFYLAELYQDGKAGLKKDATESRRWLERAAEGGDRTAMHNLALDLHEGVGGSKNDAASAEWFRRAAELGLLDSQFNLAAIYEHGDGVSQNAAEAYKWYLIAARAGDAEAKAGALRVRAGLSPDARAMSERAAADFQPGAATPGAIAAPAGAGSPDLVIAQRALMQLGYYQGPTDGVASPALIQALQAYQRDQSLPVSGKPDAATVGKLSVYTNYTK